MSKQGVYKISGNTKPKVGETVTYTIDEWYPATPREKRNPALVTWHLFKKVNGSFVPTTIKKKGISSFTFQNTAYKNTYRIEAYLYEPEGKAPMALEVQPQQGDVPRINGIQLKYADNTPGNVFSFTEKLIAESQCTGLEGKYLTFTLWEDDIQGNGHDARNMQIDRKKGKVISGVAKAEFTLTSALMKKAMQGETDVKQLEFYVTVEYYENKKHASRNVHINPPQEIYIPSNKPKPKPAPPNSQPKVEGSPAEQKGPSQKEQKGIIETTTETISGVVSKIEKKIYDWGEAKGTVKKDQKPAPPPPSGKSPTVVKDLPQKEKKDEKGTCFCNRDFTSAEFEKIIYGLRDSESRVKKDSGYSLFAADNCNLKSEDKTIEKLKNQINSIFTRYGINTCIRKLHFLAQIYHETDRLRTTLEYATNKEYKPYFGRGLMQLTWEKNYKLYEAYSGTECVNNYKIISENLYYACDSAGWYWKQGKVLSIGERWKGPSDPPIYVKNQNPNYPKTTITWKDGAVTKKYGTLDLGLIADDDKVDLISYLINGGANGLQERRNYVLTLKSIFKYPQECINKKTSSTKQVLQIMILLQ